MDPLNMLLRRYIQLHKVLFFHPSSLDDISECYSTVNRRRQPRRDVALYSLFSSSHCCVSALICLGFALGRMYSSCVADTSPYSCVYTNTAQANTYTNTMHHNAHDM